MSRPYSQPDVFKAIADPTRRAILTEIGTGKKTVGELHALFDMTMPALSRHLQVLREVNLVQQTRSGRNRIYTLRPEPLREVMDWLTFFEQFWDQKLDNLGQYLEEKHGRD